MGLIGVIFLLAVLAFPFYVLHQLGTMRSELNELKAVMKHSKMVSHDQAVPTQVTAPSIYGDAYTEAKAVLAATAASSAPTPAIAEPLASPVPPARPVYTPSIGKAYEPSAVERWFTEDIFMKIGAFLILLALGWFVSYAFMNNWIGPVGRIAAGVGLGFILMAVGVWRAGKDVGQAVVFCALGMTTVLLSIYAARFAYDFFTPATALIFMFTTVAVTAGISIRLQAVSLAVVALLGGAMAPLLAHTADPDVLGLHVYLALLIAGALFVSVVLRTPALILISFVIACLYGAPYLAASDLEQAVARVAAFAFSGAFLFFSTVSLIRTKPVEYQLYLTTILGVAFYIALWIALTVSAGTQGLLALAVAAVFLFAGALLWEAYEDKTPAYVHVGVSIAYLALATSYYLDGMSLVIAYVGQITTMTLVSLWAIKDLRLARTFSLLYVGPVLLSLPYFTASVWDTGVIHAESIVLALIGAILIFVGFAFAKAGDDSGTDLTLVTAGAVYYLGLVWLVAQGLFGDQIGTAVSLVIYTVIGLALYFGGQKTDDEYARIFGAVMIGGVVARLLFVDVWELELIFRIIAFFVIGVLLLSTAFYLKKHP